MNDQPQPACDCKKTTNSDRMHVGMCYGGSEWQKVFLDEGTKQIGKDLSCLVSVISGIIATERSKWVAEVRREIEKRRIDAHKLRRKVSQERKGEKDAWQRGTEVGAFAFPHNALIDDLLNNVFSLTPQPKGETGSNE